MFSFKLFQRLELRSRTASLFRAFSQEILAALRKLLLGTLVLVAAGLGLPKHSLQTISLRDGLLELRSQRCHLRRRFRVACSHGCEVTSE